MQYYQTTNTLRNKNKYFFTSIRELYSNLDSRPGQIWLHYSDYLL